MHFTIVGGGLVGLGTALSLQKLFPGVSLLILEKEPAPGRHQSTHNSGVLHAGLYYAPGSLKARLAVTGIRRMVAFCATHHIPHEICGKLVVATTAEEIPRLRILLDRGAKNGLANLRWLEQAELREIEPHAAGIAAVHVPEEGIVDYAAVVRAMAHEFSRAGGKLICGAELLRADRRGNNWELSTTAGNYSAEYIVNCAGLQSDRVAALTGERPATRIVPFRGEYYHLRTSARKLVRNLIYPVPDPSFPFLGVHFTRMIGGGVEAGPNAVLALKREGYRRWAYATADAWDSLTYRGLWNFFRRHRGMVMAEMARSASRAKFCASLQRLVPALQPDDLEPGGAGVRAQALNPDGTLVQDFLIVTRPGALHVLNTPSPGATASLSLGEYIARQALLESGREPREEPLPARKIFAPPPPEAVALAGPAGRADVVSKKALQEPPAK